MKHLLLPFLLSLISLSAIGQTVQSYFGFTSFSTSTETPYVEAYFAVDASTLQFVKTGDKYQAGAIITVLFLQDDEVINFDKFNLLSQKISDTTTQSISFNIMALRRIALENGTFDVEVIITDANDPENKTTYPSEPITIDFPTGEIAISDLRLVQSVQEEKEGSVFNKNGFKLFPHLINYYPTSFRELHFYAEVYNLDEAHLDEDVLLVYSIHQPGSVKPISGLMKYSKQKGQGVNVLIGSLGIKDLPSGMYDLKVQVRSRENKLLAEKSMVLYRSNKEAIANFDNLSMLNVENTFTDELEAENMDWYLKSLKPIASKEEKRAINTVLAEDDTTLQRQFFYNFWASRNMAAPEEPWDDHYERVLFVRDEFRIMNRYGFETDRGRVYLQYGEPQERFESSYESDAEPYEIWRYNRTPIGETNVIFVFKSFDLISNDYELIHSNATGEIKDQNWKARLKNTFSGAPGFDESDGRGSFGNTNSEIFDEN